VIVGRSGSVQGWGAQDTAIISRKPLTAADCDRARALFAAANMQAIYLPDAAIQNPFYELLHTSDPAGFERRFVFDIRPVTDNRPFFFYTVQPRDLLTFLRTASHDTADYKVNKAVPLLFGLALISGLATLLIMVLPPLLLGTRLPRQPGVLKFLLYFLFIGAGYILIEVALIQRFVLFLGHPTPALTVVIFSLLVSSGLGSAAAGRLTAHLESRLIKILGCVAMLATLLGLVLASLLTALVWLPLPLKAVITVALIAPLGFVMGMPFPSGLRRLEQWHPPSVRWAWALNAAASVLGSVCALVSAIYLGLVETMIIGSLFYLAALAVVARVHTGESPAPQPGANRVVLAS
jgi:hypothetical protein